jgi:hypothetical protein
MIVVVVATGPHARIGLGSGGLCLVRVAGRGWYNVVALGMRMGIDIVWILLTNTQVGTRFV